VLLQGARALEAIASPARQELVSAIGEGAATARELAARLGRSRQSLYHHVDVLVRAGLVREAGTRGEGRRRERVYALPGEAMAVGGRASSRADLPAANRAAQAMLRLTGREIGAALRERVGQPSGAQREMVALRGKARLGPRDLRRLNALIDRIQAILQNAKGGPQARRMYAVTLVLTPARDAASRADARSRRPAAQGDLS
jgi:DNA-binding transcriptional ArsR family regulator